MAKKKRIRRTAEEQRAFDERTKVIDEILAEKWRTLEQSRAQRRST